MAGKSDTFENDLLKLIFNATAIANISDNAASSPLTNLFVALHTADPTDSGTQTSNEVAYTSYARVAVARTSGGICCVKSLTRVSGSGSMPRTIAPRMSSPRAISACCETKGAAATTSVLCLTCAMSASTSVNPSPLGASSSM